MGPFPLSEGKEYILLAVDYVSKWVEVILKRTNNHRVVNKFIFSNIFSQFGCPRVIISDGGSHFTKSHFRILLKIYGVHHRVTTPYHPQENGQIDVSNREVKNILKKIIRTDRRDWAAKLPDALWAYRTAFKTPIGCLLLGLFIANLATSLSSSSVEHSRDETVRSSISHSLVSKIMPNLPILGN